MTRAVAARQSAVRGRCGRLHSPLHIALRPLLCCNLASRALELWLRFPANNIRWDALEDMQSCDGGGGEGYGPRLRRLAGHRHTIFGTPGEVFREEAEDTQLTAIQNRTGVSLNFVSLCVPQLELP